MDLIQTIAGSLMEGFLPKGWDLAKIDRLAATPPSEVSRREKWWHPQFEPVPCVTFADFDTFMGHEIAREIELAKQTGQPIVFILPVGPMGRYLWTASSLTESTFRCDHVYGFS